MKKLRDFDSADRVYKFRVAGFSAIAGIGFGVALSLRFGLPGLIGGLLMGVVMYFVIDIVADRSGTAASTIYFGSGSSTPHQREYSQGDTYAVRGQWQEAADEYERCAVIYPDDPEPRVRLARLLRDGLKQPEQAAHWFRQVLAVPKLEPQVEIATMRELIELYTTTVGDRARALPVLAKLAELHPNNPSGQWARTELMQLKRELLT